MVRCSRQALQWITTTPRSSSTPTTWIARLFQALQVAGRASKSITRSVRRLGDDEFSRAVLAPAGDSVLTFFDLDDAKRETQRAADGEERLRRRIGNERQILGGGP